MLTRVQKLVFETEALDFVEIECHLFREDLVDGDSCYRFLALVVDLVEGKCGLASVDLQLSFFRLELPGDFILSVSHEADHELAKDVDLLVLLPVVLVRLLEREAKLLADHVVKWNRQKVRTKQEQSHTIEPVELTPLGFLLEHLKNLNCLNTLLNRHRQ